MKKIIAIILLGLMIFAIGLVGQADYEEETIEINNTQKTRMPYWYE